MASDNDIDGRFDPVRTGDLTDLELLPGEFRAFAREVRSSFELLGNRILPALTKIETTMADMALRVSDIERQQIKMAQRIDDLEARMVVPRVRKAKR